MLKYYHAVQDVSRRIADAIDGSVDALKDGRIEQEPAMTDRMLGAIEESLRDYRAKGIRWSAKTLTDRGKGAQEARIGADFMGVLNVDLPDYKVAKGFLAQAKLIKEGRAIDLAALRQQCERMLDLSPASFVFLYSQEGVRVIPAIAVLASSFDPLAHYHHSAQRFYADHLECFIGDRAIAAATPAQLDRLATRFTPRSVISVSATSDPSSLPVQSILER